MKDTYQIKKKYIIFRDEANNLRKAIERKNSKNIYLDFSKVSFFSRSFGDELLNIIKDLEKKKLTVKTINLKPKLEIFLKQIKKRREEINKELGQ